MALDLGPTNQESAAPRPWTASVPPLALLVVLVLVAAFNQHFVWLWQKGWHNEYYGHGFLIPIICAYLIYRRKDHLATLPRTGCWIGLPVLLAGLALHILAIIQDVNFPQGFAFVTVIIGLTIWLYGWPVARDIAFPLAFLLFMVPMGRVLVDTFAQPMQLISARVAGHAAGFLGIPVAIDGTTLRIPDYTFEVGIPCSGLKSAIAMTALGALYAYVLQGTWQQRAAIFAMSLPAALVANAVRIWLTLVLAISFGPSAAEGFFHTLSGMVVFVLALLGLFGFGSLIHCTTLREDI
ncbi:MAG: exosortase/archaeosortase family protein [Armatimonadia bacterium]